jgi:transcription elongation factor GreA
MEKYITKEGLEKLKKELEFLKTDKRKEVADKLKHAAAFGDLSENAAYEEAKESQTFLEMKIAELNYAVKNAIIIKTNDSGKAQHGSKITLLDNKNQEEIFQIVDSIEADPLKGKISMTSPLGSRLLGKKIGDSVTLETPEGKMIYSIKDIN